MSNPPQSPLPRDLSQAAQIRRRTVIAASPWTIPVAAAAVSTPTMAASGKPNYVLSSNFGIGWWPCVQKSTNSGVLLLDTTESDKYFRVEGTTGGETLTDVWIEVLIQTTWTGGSSLTWFYHLATAVGWQAGTGPTTETVDGGTYYVWKFTYTGVISGTAGQTNLPVFQLRASTAFGSPLNGPYCYARVRRHVKVNGQDLVLFRAAAAIPNTNQPPSKWPGGKSPGPCK